MVLELSGPEAEKKPTDMRALLSRLNEQLGVDERQLAYFIGAKIKTNEERGYRKWCIPCDAWTGHMILPTKAWQLERCMRCGRVTELLGIGAKTDQGKAMLIRPDMTPGQILRDLLIPVLGASFIVRAMEEQYRRDVEAAKHALLAERAAKKETQFKRDVEDF